MAFPPVPEAQSAYARQRRRMRAVPRWAVGRWARMPANLRGAMWVLASAVLFTVMQVLVKLLGGSLHAFEVAFFRALTGVIFIAPVIWRTGPAGFRASRPGLMILRGVVGSTAMLCGFYAIAHLPLADATSISFARALFVVPLAILILGESIGPRRIMATLVGFAGVLIISWPSGAIELGTLAAVGNAFFVALAIIFVKILSRTDSTSTLLFYSGVIGMITTAIPAALYWQWPNAEELGLLFLMGGVGVAAHSCFIRAYAVGEASALAPLDYTRIIFSTLAGIMIFATIPGWQTVLGAIIIAGSSLYITLREAKTADVETAPADETGTSSEPLDYALRQKRERDMVERGTGD
jgi:drug/metabolite transporter (DMT)-like permease